VRITAQIARGDEAYVALERDRPERGPNGESTVAEIWHTTDLGQTWRAVPWRRALRTFVSRGAFATWPPESVHLMWLRGTSLMIEVREDWGLNSRWEPPIWCATWNGETWRVRYDRRYNVEVDGVMTSPRIELDLPGITRPPVLGPFR